MKIISNLSQSVLCPFQIIVDTCLQLERSFAPSPAFKTIKSRLFQPVCPLNSPTDWVNLDDSVGDLTAMRGFELTSLLCSILNTCELQTITFHLLLGTNPLCEDTIFSLIYLADAGFNLSLHLYITAAQNAEISPSLAILQEKIKTDIDYQPENTFFSQVDDPDLPEAIDQNRQTLLGEQGLTFFDQTPQQLQISDSNQGSVLHYAWLCLKAGAYRLSCRVLQMALSHPALSQKMREEYFLQLQVIRFLSHQHHAVASETFPAQFDCIDSDRVAYLYFIKAFSATMVRDLEVARSCYQQANISVDMPLTDEDSIYKLNLYALFLVLAGHADQAFTLEHQLLEYICYHYPQAVAINHVIRMNIARLYKKRQLFDQAEAHYEQAYAQLSGGGFTLFDHMNYEMDKAIIFEARHESQKALFSWLKVTMYWYSCPNPYALAVRPRLTLAQEKVTDTLTPLSLEKVHQFLLNKLTTLYVLLDKGIASENKDTPDSHHLKNEQDLNYYLANNVIYDIIAGSRERNANKTCHIVDHMIIYSYHQKTENTINPFPQSHTEKRLRTVVSSLIKKWFDLSDTCQAISIETLFDRPTKQSQTATVALAHLTDCHEAYFQGHRLTLNQQPSSDAYGNFDLTLPEMLDSIEKDTNGIRLIYRRSYLNQTVTDPEMIKVIERLQKDKRISALKLKEASPEIVYRMLNQKMICVLGCDDPAAMPTTTFVETTSDMSPDKAVACQSPDKVKIDGITQT